MQSHLRFIQFKKFLSIRKLMNILSTREIVNVTIPVPWGQLSGKWYGPLHEQPILGLHGLQDNAGSYDLLAPLLPKQIAFLSIDLPGHGLSSHLPRGVYYSILHNVYVVRLIMEYYKWEKLYVIGHSIGSIIAFMFAATYPKKMAMYIGLDAIHIPYRPLTDINTIGKSLEKILLEDKRQCLNAEPPCYTYNEVIERVYEGSKKSINKDLCKYLAVRHIKESRESPNKYFFTRDRRLKYLDLGVHSQEVFIEMSKRILCPFLYIKALQSQISTSNNEMLKILTMSENFYLHQCHGTHHVHINNPAHIIKPITEFIEHYGPLSSNNVPVVESTQNNNILFNTKL